MSRSTSHGLAVGRAARAAASTIKASLSRLSKSASASPRTSKACRAATADMPAVFGWKLCRIVRQDRCAALSRRDKLGAANEASPAAMSMRARELSLGAERTRRWRQRRQHGLVVVSFDVAPDITAELIRLGWLDATKRGDKEAIATALIELAGRATELEVTPASPSM